jgi:hypothetical protein
VTGWRLPDGTAWRGRWGIVPSCRDPRARLREGGLAELQSDLRIGYERTEKDGPAIVYAELDPPYRAAANVTATSALAYDVDGAAVGDLQELVARIRSHGWAALAHGSWSDGIDPDVWRARVVIPLAEACPGAQHRDLWRHVETLLGVPGSDGGCVDPSRLWYTLRRACPGRAPWLRVYDGTALDPRPLLAELEAEKARAKAEADAERARWYCPPRLANNPHEDRRQRAYAAAALRNAAERILGTAHPDRHRTLLRESCGLFGLVKAGLLERAEVVATITSTARDVLPEHRHREIPKALAWAEANATPREIQHGR